MPEQDGLLIQTRSYACLDCGQCTSVCPVANYNPAFSPRKLVQDAALGKTAELAAKGSLWACVTCSRCQQFCRAGVNFTGLVQSLRADAAQEGNGGDCTHGGVLRAMMQFMASPDLRQDRLGWVTPGLRTAARGEVLYFTGCQPYFDVIFKDIGARTLEGPRGAVRLLNHLGIEPVLLPDERCCGHDMLWSGDTGLFTRLAEHNMAEIRKSGARRVVTTCPECYYMLKVEYPRVLGETGLEVVHLSQVLSEQSSRLNFKRVRRKIAYHDPCRLGRFSGVYDEPRGILGAIPGIELREMTRNREQALCCGTQAWVNCGSVNKRIQVELLREAAATGAETLVTACPKCEIHLKCALHDDNVNKDIRLAITDLTSLAAKALDV